MAEGSTTPTLQGCDDGVEESLCDVNGLNIIDLPDVVMVNIMSYLDYTDKYQAALTCHRMNDMMNHPSGWSRIRLDIPVENQSVMALRFIAMVDKFGTYFQHVELRYLSYCQPIQSDVTELLQKLSAKCRLRSLVLYVSFVETKRVNLGSFNVLHLKEHYDALCILVTTSNHLKSFTLRSWPAGRAQPEKNEVLDALCANDHNKGLETLHMFWPDWTESNWALRKANQTPSHALAVVKHFSSLTALSLPSYMMNQGLLDEIAKGNRTRLVTLRILVVFSNSDRKLKIPDLSWQPVREACPELEVEVVFNSRVPSAHMAKMLCSDLPLSVLYFMAFARVRADEIDAIAAKYGDTLKKFICYADCSDADDALLSLVNACENLHTLVFYGGLNFQTIMELAEGKGKKWARFVMKKEAVDFKQKRIVDPDKVLDWDEESREYRQVDMMRWGETDESLREKEERLKILVDSVTESLGCPWKPFSEDK